MALLVDTIIPFAPDGQVDLSAVRAHTLWLRASGIDGFAVGLGELLNLDRKEKERVLEVVMEVAPEQTVLFPIWDTSPGFVVKLGRLAAQRGAQVLLPPPLLVRVSDDALVDWYRSVGDHLSVPVLAWHDARFANPLTPRLLGRLRAETSVTGWLDASGDAHRVRRLAVAWPDHTWACLDSGLDTAGFGAISAQVGLHGAVSLLANAWPDLVLRAWRDREPGIAEALVRRAVAVDRAGGRAALKRVIGVGTRLPLAGVDLVEAARLPTSSFR